jgi:hypothetical protein
MEPRPELLCVRAAAPPDFGHEHPTTWRAATPVALVRVDDGEPPRQATAVRILWDPETLYLRFDATDDEILADCTERDGSVWKDDCVEVFLDPNPAGRIYFELEVNTLGTVFDAVVVNRQHEGSTERDLDALRDWTCKGLRTAHGRSDGGYWVELAIPTRQLAPERPPGPGQTWRCNLFRVDRFSSSSPSGSSVGYEHQAFSPTGRIDFHRPEAFALLVFV